MSLAEIVKALPELKRDERRELVRRLFEVEDEEGTLLREADQRADERFGLLDAMEESDGQAGAR